MTLEIETLLMAAMILSLASFAFGVLITVILMRPQYSR